MSTRKMNLAVVVTVLASLVASIGLSQTIPEVNQSQFKPVPNDLRDIRYCEVIPIFLRGGNVITEVYNTLSLNDCPAELWAELDAEAMAETYNARDVRLNGPRYWVMNQLIGSDATAAGKTVDFNGIEMTLRAIIETEAGQSTVGEALYQENEVQRTTTYVYRAGNMVYELTSPEGDVYRMQSYAQLADPTLTIDDLETLGERLELPEGWRYQARVLTEDSQLTADGLAFVINDDLANSYQKVLDEVLETSTAQAGKVPLLEYHDGYWVTEMQIPGQPVPITVINDMHIDAATNSVTVYAQNRMMGRILAPAQVGPGECTETPTGETACFHPDAVYLNGSGEELSEADGTGAWWVKHSWVLPDENGEGGEGYDNCELKLAESYDDCAYVEGVLLEDGLSMKVGIPEPEAGEFYNIRTPLLDEDPIRYSVIRFAPKNTDPEVGEVDLTPTAQWVLVWDCVEEPSALDSRARSCPEIEN